MTELPAERTTAVERAVARVVGRRTQPSEVVSSCRRFGLSGSLVDIALAASEERAAWRRILEVAPELAAETSDAEIAKRASAPVELVTLTRARCAGRIELERSRNAKWLEDLKADVAAGRVRRTGRGGLRSPRERVAESLGLFGPEPTPSEGGE